MFSILSKSIVTAALRAAGATVVLGVFFRASVPAFAMCGLDWQVPTNHFANVNERGEFSYWLDVGEIDLGDDLQVPLVIGFKPNRGGNSWLGRGWVIPVIESNIVQVDEWKFLLTQPDGISRRFWREKADSNVLRGQGGWAGEIRGNTITLWADCGWRLTFFKGKISAFTTPSGRTLTIVFTNGKPTEIQEKGRTLFKVESDSVMGKITGLRFGETKIDIELGEKLIVEVVAQTSVVSGIERSLHSLKFANGQQTTYDFSVDEKVRPTVKISERTNAAETSECLIVWDTETGRLVQDGEWTYEITPSLEDRWANAALGRLNAKQQKEFWYLNKEKGEEIITTLDGVTRTSSWFAAGPFAGKMRQVEEEKDGIKKIVEKNSYDEQGRIIRQVNELGIVQTWTYAFPDKGEPSVVEYEHDNDPEHKAKRDAMAKERLDELANAKTQHEKDEALLHLVYLYMHTFKQPEKAAVIVPQIQTDFTRFTASLHWISWNHQTTPMEKLAKYYVLQKEFQGYESTFQNFISVTQNMVEDYKKVHGIK